MARRGDHTQDEIKELVIIAGQNIIKQAGISGFSARKISREIGYSIGTLYNIFDSHEDIILNINARTLDDLKLFIEEKKYSSNENILNNIKKLAHLYVEFASANYNCWNAIFEFHEPIEFVTPKWYEEKTQELFKIIEIALEDIFQSKDCLERHAKIIWAGIHGVCLLNIKKKLNISGVKKVETLTDLLIENYLYGAQNQNK